MTLLCIVGVDHGLLLRWAAVARARGFDPAILPAEALGKRPRGEGFCLWDLGPQPGLDLRRLERVLRANAGTGFAFMSARPDPAEGLRLLRTGARGYANRLLSRPVLGELLDTVRNGELWAGRQVTDYLLARALSEPLPSRCSLPPDPELLHRLSSREAEVAARVAAGASNKVIASDMAITERTVKAHLNSVFRKTGVRNRVQLALALSGQVPDPAQLSSG